MTTAGGEQRYGRGMGRAGSSGVAVLLAACVGLAGCSAPSAVSGTAITSATAAATATTATAATTGTTGAPATSASPTPSPTTLRGLCAAALPDRTLLGWGAADVGDFRAYNYGPANHKPPLAKAFPGADDSVAGAWCATRAAKQATAWWAVVWQRTPRRAITIVGPGEGRSLARVSGPPVVP